MMGMPNFASIASQDAAESIGMDLGGMSNGFKASLNVLKGSLDKDGLPAQSRKPTACRKKTFPVCSPKFLEGIKRTCDGLREVSLLLTAHRGCTNNCVTGNLIFSKGEQMARREKSKQDTLIDELLKTVTIEGHSGPERPAQATHQAAD